MASIVSSWRGRNSWSGGSSRRMVTGQTVHHLEDAGQSRPGLQTARSLARASARRAGHSSSAMIISRMGLDAVSSPKNMCSVRHRDRFPRAPKLPCRRVRRRCVSALARTRHSGGTRRPRRVNWCGNSRRARPFAWSGSRPSRTCDRLLPSTCDPRRLRRSKPCRPVSRTGVAHSRLVDAHVANATRRSTCPCRAPPQRRERSRRRVAVTIALCGNHAVEVVRIGLVADQDDLLALARPNDSASSALKTTLAGRPHRDSRPADRRARTVGSAAGSTMGVQQLRSKLVGSDCSETASSFG